MPYPHLSRGLHSRERSYSPPVYWIVYYRVEVGKRGREPDGRGSLVGRFSHPAQMPTIAPGSHLSSLRGLVPSLGMAWPSGPRARTTRRLANGYLLG